MDMLTANPTGHLPREMRVILQALADMRRDVLAHQTDGRYCETILHRAKSLHQAIEDLEDLARACWNAAEEVR